MINLSDTFPKLFNNKHDHGALVAVQGNKLLINEYVSMVQHLNHLPINP